MKVRGIHIFSILLLAAACCYGVKLFSRTFAVLPVTFFSIDERFSEAEQQTIALFLEEHHQALSPQVALLLKEKFPAVASVALDYARNGVDVRALQPLVAVNGTHLLCEQGPLIPIAHYNQSVVTALPAVTVDEAAFNDTVVDQLRTFVCGIPHRLYDRFSLAWYGPTHIVFQDTAKPDHCVVVDETVIPSDAQLAQCDAVYACMRELHKKVTTTIVTDIRFEKQIITYGEKGGDHGNRIV